jgi:hypothetical protein
MSTRRFGPLLRAIGALRRTPAVHAHNSIELLGARPHRFGLSPWNAIISLSLIVLLSGCGGLSVTSKSALVANPAAIAFGNVAIGQTLTTSVTLQNQGLSTIEIENISVSGSAFSVTGSTKFPISLAAGASVTIQLQFSPVVAGSATEPLMITSSVSTNPTSIAEMTGVGIASGGPKKVQLTWLAPNSASSAIVGYNIYRSANGTGYQLLNSAVDQGTTYTDASVQSGSGYDYYVESVDASGNQSPPSNTTTVAVP